jgi:hypothetical protein
MKRFFQTIFALIALGCSSAAAEEFTVAIGLHSFNVADPNIRSPSSIAGFGMAIMPTFDFETRSSGPGVRAVIQFDPLLVIGTGVDAYYRIPLDAQGMNLYFGAGGTFTLGILPFVNFLEVHGLIGLDVPMDDRNSFFIEVNPGVIVSGSEFRFDSFSSSSNVPLDGVFAVNIVAGLRIVSSEPTPVPVSASTP